MDNKKLEVVKTRTGFIAALDQSGGSSAKTLEKYGIKLHSIYEDLEKVVLHEGKRKLPLCKQVYGFNGELTESEEIEF